MRKIISLYCICLSIFTFSQKGFDVLYEADYKLSYKIDNTPNTSPQITTFALLINKNASYFKNMNRYIEDSLVLEKKLEYKNAKDGIDFNQVAKFRTDFPENIGTTSHKIYYSTTFDDQEFQYEEQNNQNWKIINEFKTINGYKCQKAETTKYGRKWIAFFTEEIPFQYGPYKFSKLPGLIIELFDSNKDYYYTMYQFRKRPYFCKSANINRNPKKITKEKIFNLQRNKYITRINQFEKYLTNKDEIEELRRTAINSSKTYNPIELTIY